MVKSEKPKTGRRGGFKEGPDSSRNYKGRPKGSTNKYDIGALMAAIRQVEKKKERKKLLIEFVEQAYDNPTIMTALMKKLLPDLKSIEGFITTFEDSMTDEIAKSIQAELVAKTEAKLKKKAKKKKSKK